MNSEFSFEGKKILVVDDQRPFQVMIRGMLKSLDAEDVAVASSGENALLKCSNESYDVLLIDYNLGTGRNGRQLFEELRTRDLIKPSCVSILVTGESQSTVVVGAIETQPDDYIVKPFSQNVLLQRTGRAWQKRQAFLPYFKAFYKQEYKTALQALSPITEQFPRYRNLVSRSYAECLYRAEEYSPLEEFINECLQQKRTTWALMYKARLHQQRGEYLKAIAVAKETVIYNKLNMEAYDLIADCYLAIDELEQSYYWIKSGIEKSPFSINRQYKLSSIAKLNEDFEVSIKACNQVVDLTSHSFKRDYQHVLNHIRNIIEICELEQDEQKRRKYNQEVIHALQRSKRDSAYFTDYSQEDFETICMARLDSVNGMTYRAKKNFAELSGKYSSEGIPLPLELLADSVLLLYKIGDFDKAADFTKVLTRNEQHIDPFTKDMLKHAKQNASQAIDEVKSLNKQGIEQFKTGNLQAAIELFEESLRLAPMNTGSALNLIHALLDKADKEKREKPILIEKCKTAFKIVNGMPIGEGHKKRAEQLNKRFDEMI